MNAIKIDLFYVYIHKKASSGSIFYVGKGAGNRVKSRSGRSNKWKNIVSKHGIIHEIIKYFSVESEAYLFEKLIIKKLRGKGIDICNIAPGGEGRGSGWRHDNEMKKKFSDAKTGKKQSPEHAAKSAIARLGHKNSPEAIEKTMQSRRRAVRSSDGNTYASSRDAARAMQEKHGGGFSQGNISSAASGKRKSAYGLEWSYVDELKTVSR